MIKVVCSDKKQHDPVTLYAFTDYRHVLLDEDIMWIEGERHGSPLAAWTRDGGGRTYRFRCPACPRDAELREENLFRAFDAIGGQREGDTVPVLDISLLPLVAIAPSAGSARLAAELPCISPLSKEGRFNVP